MATWHIMCLTFIFVSSIYFRILSFFIFEFLFYFIPLLESITISMIYLMYLSEIWNWNWKHIPLYSKSWENKFVNYQLLAVRSALPSIKKKKKIVGSMSLNSVPQYKTLFSVDISWSFLTSININHVLLTDDEAIRERWILYGPFDLHFW